MTPSYLDMTLTRAMTHTRRYALLRAREEALLTRSSMPSARAAPTVSGAGARDSVSRT